MIGTYFSIILVSSTANVIFKCNTDSKPATNQQRVKIAHIAGASKSCQQEYKATTNTYYTWSCYHLITNHTIYVHRRTTSTVYFICKSRTNKTGFTSVDTRND